MDEKKYIVERLDDQINWYSKKSKRNQTWFKTLLLIEIISAASIPFLSVYANDSQPLIKAAIGLLGVLIVVIAGAVSLNKFQEVWIQYRTTAESLKHNKYLYLTMSVPYDGDDAFHLLVENVENCISKENSTWSSFITKKQEGSEIAKR